MKRALILLLTAIMILVMTGCNAQSSSSDTVPPSNNKTINDNTKAKASDGIVTSDTSPNKDPSDNNTANQAVKEYISEDDVKTIVLSHAVLNEQDIKYYTIHLDYDDDFRRYEYDVSFHADKYEYDYEVDALTGDIIDFDKEHIWD